MHMYEQQQHQQARQQQLGSSHPHNPPQVNESTLHMASSAYKSVHQELQHAMMDMNKSMEPGLEAMIQEWKDTVKENKPKTEKILQKKWQTE